MSESANFRITLNLSHFFQDHRSICKIFINKRMKHIIDLQSHIEQIFQLKDFHLISHGHYIPISEDVRVLQHDDIVIAVPNRIVNIPIYTSTPRVRKVDNCLPKKETRKRQSEQDENDIILEDSPVHIKKKKKKKHKEKVSTDNNIQFEEIKQSEIQINAECEKNIKYDVAKVSKKIKKLKKHNIFNDFNVNKDEADLNNSVKEKVLYFEEQNKSVSEVNEELLDINEICADKQSNTTINSKKEVTQQRDSDEFRRKKLLVQKCKADICYDLPKKSNIVKSILISNNRDNYSKSPMLNNHYPKTCNDLVNNTYPSTAQKDVGKLTEEKCNSIIWDPKKSAMHRKIAFQNLAKLNYHQLESNVDMNITYSEFEKTNDEDIGDAKKKIIEEIQAVNITDKISMRESSDFMNKASTDTENMELNNDNENITKDELIEPENIELNNRDENITESVEIIEPEIYASHKDGTNNSSLISKELDHSYSIEYANQSVYMESDSAISSEVNLSTSGCLQNNTYSEREPSISSNNDFKCMYDTSFVTKRKRKRSHRKRKSKKSTEETEIPPKASFEYIKPFVMQTPACPAIHIKFNDEDERTTITEKIQETNDQNAREGSVGMFNSSLQLSTNGEDLIESTQIKDVRNGTALLVEDKNDNFKMNKTAEKIPNKLSISSNILLSDDTILISPLMQNTKPKYGDLIAFKVLRLTKDYTPELSRNIIGEVVKMNEDTLDVDIQIIDGLDQFREPDGKFSIEKELDDPKNTIKSYNWASLIEPRLIFP